MFIYLELFDFQTLNTQIQIENDEDANDIINASVNQTLEQEEQSGHHEEWDKANSSFTPVYDETSGVEVVDSEPNPIRDSHHAGLLPHSPCSVRAYETILEVDIL
ncbi:unnamed protein product [Onchocerca flexuosa]|uniref:Uncharacterized protein n=1 Tax=Onchocerca flexuosa TaxID=387005 RepID=A0A183HPP7_9BILA|nr:unnamed protein product [Onchocerca flexuosa]